VATDLGRSVCKQNMVKTIYEGRISQVKVRAIAHSLLHSICKIAEGVLCRLEGESQHRADVMLGYYNVDLLCLDASNNCLFAFGADAFIQHQAMIFFTTKRRVGCDLIR